jgi:hypothetical protein
MKKNEDDEGEKLAFIDLVAKSACSTSTATLACMQMRL